MAPESTEEVEESKGLRSQMYLHEGFVAWYEDEHGIDLDTLSAAEVIAHFAARRNEYRKSDFYQTHKAEHLAAVEAEREQAKEARAAERAERKAAKEAEAAAKAEAAAEKGEKPAAKKAAKKAAKSTKATKATKGGSTEDPFA